jgi:sarcosine oxidase subunit alpha
MEPITAGQEITAGSHVVRGSGESDGWITSAGFSPVLGRHVALAMVTDGRSRIGESVTLQNLGVRTTARLSVPCAYDPDGTRLNA